MEEINHNITVYLDSNYRCHAEYSEGLVPHETEFFYGREKVIDSYRIVPFGATWIRSDGVAFYGEMIAPIGPEMPAAESVDANELEAALAEIEGF